MRRVPLLALLLALATLAPAAAGAVSADRLVTRNVVFDTGVNRPAADRTRLEQAAADLAARGFPTRFVVVARALPDMDREARRLRRELGSRIGLDGIDAVLVLAPRGLGIDAKVLACERQLAFQAEVATLEADDVQGTVNIARRLREYDAQQELRDENCNPIEPSGGGDGGTSKGLLVGGIAGAAVLVALAAVLARRAASRRRNGSVGGSEAPAAGDAPPDDRP